MSSPPTPTGEHGFVLVELLVVIVISSVVLAAALITFELFNTTSSRNQSLAESQDRTRAAAGQLARQLRNLASPTPEQPQAVEKAQAYDLVFQSVGPGTPSSGNPANVRRVRYCLDAPALGEGTLWLQSQTWTTPVPPALPSTSTCPDPGWATQRELVTRVTNRVDGETRPLFQFNSGTLAQISAVIAQLWTQTAGPEPVEGLLRTQVFLRNQNRPPQANFDPRPTGLLHVLLNASASSDPEGESLVYQWYDGSTYVGAGVVFDLKVSAPGTRSITLKAFDPAGLKSETTRTVNVL